MAAVQAALDVLDPTAPRLLSCSGVLPGAKVCHANLNFSSAEHAQKALLLLNERVLTVRLADNSIWRRHVLLTFDNPGSNSFHEESEKQSNTVTQAKETTDCKILGDKKAVLQHSPYQSAQAAPRLVPLSHLPLAPLSEAVLLLSPVPAGLTGAQVLRDMLMFLRRTGAPAAPHSCTAPISGECGLYSYMIFESAAAAEIFRKGLNG